MSAHAPTTPAPSGAGKSARPAPPSKIRKTLGMLALAAVLLLAFTQVDARWERLPAFVTEAPGYIALMTQGVLSNPVVDPNADYWLAAINAMIESIQMAWIGTLIGAAISFPLSFLAASNIAPAPVVFVTRQVLNIIRAIPELILAVAVMMPIFGFGPLAGAIALGVGSVGTLGKLSSEAIESVDTGPIEAVSASGAGKLQVLRWAVVPQVLPEIVAFWLYRFEINIRAGAILGALGAGGIGSLLSALFNVRAWDRIGITLVTIIVITIVVDQISARVRSRIIFGDTKVRAMAPAEVH
ncbi:MAG TPA: phosphonate ABC transporter, permease protein PhnE [Beutenbergiaceae bacterium]|nr:phosphonate ABC transporter, permease protein PhnE [Beutenbergiaceae bacterium]